MRSEEEMAKNAICEWIYRNLGCFPDDIIPEPLGVSKAPDYLFKFANQNYLFKFANQKIALEVTSSTHGFLLLKLPSSNNPLEEGEDRIQYEFSASKWLQKHYEKDLTEGKRWIQQKDTIMIAILSPVPLAKRGRLAKKILELLKNLYFSKQIIPWGKNAALTMVNSHL